MALFDNNPVDDRVEFETMALDRLDEFERRLNAMDDTETNRSVKSRIREMIDDLRRRMSDLKEKGEDVTDDIKRDLQNTLDKIGELF